MNTRYIYALFLAVIILWGINWTVSKVILQSIPPIWTAAIRATLAACALFTIQGLTRQLILPKKQDFPILLVIGVFHLTLFTVLMSLGLQLISVGRSVVLSYTTPLWVVPAAIFFLREQVNKYKIIGVLLGILGVLVLVDPFTLATQNTTQILGNAYLLIASMVWAISIIYIKHHTWLATPFQLISWQMMLAAIILIGTALYFEGIPHITLTTPLVGLLAYTGFLAAAFGFWAMTEVNQKLPAVIVSLGSLLTPVVGIISSQIFLGEAIELPLIIGTILILSGVSLACITSHSSKK